jgi:DUF971 family protein
MRPIDIQQIGHELAIKWDDGAESFITLEKLRKNCPCAGCRGEGDLLGNVYRPQPIKLNSTSFQLVRLANVGGYAIQPVWGDGHASGLFAFDLLRRVADSAE